MTERLCESILQIIIIGNLSFRQAENWALVKLVKEGFPTCDPLNRNGVVEHLQKEANLERTSLMDRMDAIDSLVSLAMDAWHSKVGNIEFLGMSSCGWR